MLTLSTITETPSTSKTLSSSLARSKASAYWKPEQPPPRTATRRAWPSDSACRRAAPRSSRRPFGQGDRVFRGLRHFTKCSDGRGAGRWKSVWRIAALSSSPQTAVVCDTTAYLPMTCSPSAGSSGSASTSRSTATRSARAEISDFAAFYERLRASESGATTSQPSVGDFVAVYEPLLDAGPRDRLDPHLGRHIRHLRGGRPGSRAAHRGGQGRRAYPGLRLALGGRWDGALHARAAAAAAAGGSRRGGPRPRRAGAGGAEDVVRDRHPRVPAARRPDRRRSRLDRLGAEDQADPHPGGGDHPDRAGPDPGQVDRAAARLRAPAPRVRHRRLGRPAHPGPRDRRRPWSKTAARYSAASPPSSPRSAPCSAPTSAPACSASARVSKSVLE